MGALLARVFATLALVAATLSGAFAQADWPKSLIIGTASAGGTYYDYGNGLARLLSRELGIHVIARPTGGPAENIELLEKGEIQLAFVTQGVALQAWNASGALAGGGQQRAMRALFPMYDTPFQFVVLADSAIQSVADFAGKRVGVGPSGGTTANYFPQFLKVLKTDATLINGDWSDLAAKVEDKSLDALAVGAGAPVPAFAEIERKTKVRYLPLTSAQIRDLRLALPELGTATVPAGSYPSLRRHYPTVGLYNFAVAHRDLPDDLAYAIVDAVFAHQDTLIDAHPAAAETTPANFTRNTFIPFHPGAARWFRGRAVPGMTHSD
ncbi:ABC transporter, phosphonate, periplasmic substrate-binding protein [Variibacter gotjawalensis]|uniref:ABC transporter, phosphonate, periplasmic substrate-binding protein n=1 Tax=Variibacter gotjawalensis TaxID=1333996 RepID=A0A0S3PU56_9BRAD|nr:TAXI family TRAP transporter solute-binding subunit [Variibacter gotjawalensis]NIK49675.1 hypothetical protein [Variibacter gotjawalensis]RZS45687.1 hypothetical protein EV661_4008 [Variibacter gotjawalensis]BAT59358.1 ABC transporter, phosphonate, periplasmic substrate-binding protein [Variibacter gotjawalensis]